MGQLRGDAEAVLRLRELELLIIERTLNRSRRRGVDAARRLRAEDAHALRKTGKRIALGKQPFHTGHREPGLDEREQRERLAGHQAAAHQPRSQHPRMIGRG